MQTSAVVIGVASVFLGGISSFVRFAFAPEPALTWVFDPAGTAHAVPDWVCELATSNVALCLLSEPSEPTGTGYVIATGVGTVATAAVAHLAHRHRRPNAAGAEAGAALVDPVPW